MTELPAGASPVDAITAGTRVREWEVVRFVGRGSYGVVFEARRSSWLDEPPRALKVFDPIISSALRSALLGEFGALTEMRHPHLLAGVDAFDLVEPPFAGCVVFVLELADEDLAHRVVRGGPLPPTEAAGVVAEVADGLAALHAQGRIHGDVKPENILRVGDRWVLGDFGVSGLLEGSYAVTPGATIDYRPPELAQAAEGTPQHRSTDIWALGVSLHVAATGRHPFPGPDPLMRYAAAVRGDRAVVPGLDPALAAVIDEGCLLADPHRRLSAATLSARLRALAARPAAPAPTGPGSPGPGSSSPGSSPRPGSSSPPRPGSSSPGSSSPSRPRRAGVGPAVLAGLAAVATFVMTQVVAVACGAVLSEVPARRAAYLAVSLAALAAGIVGLARAGPAGRTSVRAGGTAAVAVWVVSTVVLFT